MQIVCKTHDYQANLTVPDDASKSKIVALVRESLRGAELPNADTAPIQFKNPMAVFIAKTGIINDLGDYGVLQAVFEARRPDSPLAHAAIDAVMPDRFRRMLVKDYEACNWQDPDFLEIKAAVLKWRERRETYFDRAIYVRDEV